MGLKRDLCELTIHFSGKLIPNGKERADRSKISGCSLVIVGHFIPQQSAGYSRKPRTMIGHYQIMRPRQCKCWPSLFMNKDQFCLGLSLEPRLHPLEVAPPLDLFRENDEMNQLVGQEVLYGQSLKAGRVILAHRHILC